jgi:hypothetical protein
MSTQYTAGQYLIDRLKELIGAPADLPWPRWS